MLRVAINRFVNRFLYDMLRHYILTRFNLRLWRKDKNNHATLCREWLDERFQLFEKYCLPSVAGQTVKDFLWVVLFDRDTPQHYKDKVEEYKKSCPMFFPVFVRPDAGYMFQLIFQQFIERDLKALQGEGKRVEKVVTTYLDNDDALNKLYVERIQQLAVNLSDKTYITFYYGLQYFPDLNIANRVRYRENHFNSFVEVPDEKCRVLTTYCSSHAFIFKDKKYKVHSVEDKETPMWMECVHPRNVMNDILLRRRTALVTDRQMLNHSFHVDATLSENGRRIFCTTFLWRMLKTYARYARRRWF